MYLNGYYKLKYSGLVYYRVFIDGFTFISAHIRSRIVFCLVRDKNEVSLWKNPIRKFLRTIVEYRYEE